jgi:hypothetical protein
MDDEKRMYADAQAKRVLPRCLSLVLVRADERIRACVAAIRAKLRRASAPGITARRFAFSKRPMSGSTFILPGESGDGGDQSIEVLSRERDIPMSASAKATCPQPRSRAREDTMSVP